MQRLTLRLGILALALLPMVAAADPAPHLSRAARWLALDEFYAAIAEYDAALRLAPNRSDILADRALAQHRLGDVKGSRQTLGSAFAAAGLRDGAPFTARAGLALLSREDESAAGDLTVALRRTPEDQRALALQSLLVSRRGAGPPPAPREMEALRYAFGPWLSE